MGLFDKFKKALGSEEEEKGNNISNEDSNPHIKDQSFESNSSHSPHESFKHLDNLIHSGLKEISLDIDIVLADDERAEYVDGISLDIDDLVIDGNGHTIDARSHARIFFSSARNVTLRNLTLRNGRAELGGAILSGGELTIADSYLESNIAKDRGGAIYNAGKLDIINTDFNHNELDDFGYGGGAIYSQAESELNVESSLFEDNHGQHGGAISNSGEFNVVDSNFICNIAKRREMGQGGAIHNQGKMNVNNSTFLENESDDCGGAVYAWKESSSVIEECSFEKNTVGGYHGEGGAISNWGRMMVSSSRFRDNLATGEKSGDGGAINNYSGSLTIKKSVFEMNRADDSAAAIWNRSELNVEDSGFGENDSPKASVAYNASEGNLKLFNCEISHNRSIDGIIANRDSLQIHNTVFNSNSSTKSLILNDGDASLGIFNGEFIENSAPEAVLFNCGKFGSVERTVFEANMSTIDIRNDTELSLTAPELNSLGQRVYNGGHILIRKSSPDLPSRIFGDGTVENVGDVSEAKFDFGYLDRLIHSGTLEISLDEDISLEDYERDFYEGGIELDIDGLIINGNGLSIDGKGKSRIFLITGKDVTLRNIRFINGLSHRNHDNPLNSSGGALRALNHDRITIENCEFIGCASEDKGGAISCERDSTLTMDECTFESNTSKGHGGAVFCERDCRIQSIHTRFEGNSSRDHGGAIFADGHGSLRAYGTAFASNESSRGGAIYTEEDFKLEIINSRFELNRALTGAAIHNGKDSYHDILNTWFEDNESRQTGGAIYNRCEMKIAKSAFLRNTSGGSFAIGGGAIYNEGDMNVTNCEFKYNVGNGNFPGDGGSIYNKGKLDLLGGSFEENRATGAGALRNDGGTLYAFGSKFLFNRAEEKGGAISNNGSMKIDEAIFNENLAANGGGIANDGDMTIVKSDLIGNLAEENGAGIYNDDKACISETTIKDNVADYDGGAIYNANGDVKLENVYLEDITSLSNEIHNSGRLVLKGEFSTNQSKPIVNNGDVFVSSKDVLDFISNSGSVHELKSSSKDFSYLEGLINSGADEIHLDSDIVLNIANGEDRTYAKGIRIDKDNLLIDGNGHTIDAQSMVRVFNCSARDVTLKNVSLVNGYADMGGAILNEGSLRLDGSSIKGSSGVEGGAIYNSGELIVDESVLEGNESQHWGGAIYNEGSLRIVNSKVSDNKARESGGAIYGFDNPILIESSSIGNNESRKGGAIYNGGGCNIIGSSLCENRAQEGGAIHSNDEMAIIKSTLDGNEASSWGGAVYNFSLLSVVESRFGGNKSNYGGAIYNEGAELRIKDSTLSENGANYGGAIYLRDYFDREFKYESEGCTFKDNEPEDVLEKE